MSEPMPMTTGEIAAVLTERERLIKNIPQAMETARRDAKDFGIYKNEHQTGIVNSLLGWLHNAHHTLSALAALEAPPPPQNEARTPVEWQAITEQVQSLSLHAEDVLNTLSPCEGIEVTRNVQWGFSRPKFGTTTSRVHCPGCCGALREPDVAATSVSYYVDEESAVWRGPFSPGSDNFHYQRLEGHECVNMKTLELRPSWVWAASDLNPTWLMLTLCDADTATGDVLSKEDRELVAHLDLRCEADALVSHLWIAGRTSDWRIAMALRSALESARTLIDRLAPPVGTPKAPEVKKPHRCPGCIVDD